MDEQWLKYVAPCAESLILRIRDTCQFCQARLKPLIASTPADEPVIPEQPESSSDLPDWMDFDSAADFGETDDDAPFEDEADDWMTRLGGDSDSEISSQPQTESSLEAEERAASRMDFNNNGIPDWLEGLDADRTTLPLSASQELNDEIPAWLSGDEESETSEIIDDTSDLPDWLSGLGVQEEDDRLIGAAPKDAAPSPEVVSPFASGDDDLPDWLSDLGTEKNPLPEETIPIQDIKPKDADESDLLDWLAADDDSELPSAFSSDIGDLAEEPLGYVGQDTIPIKDNFQSDEAAPVLGTEDADLPDWLSDSAEGAESLPAASESDLPEWLSGSDSVETASPDEAAPILGTEDADLPDWLSEFSQQEEAEAEEGPKAQKPFDIDTSDLSGWLSDGSAEAESAPVLEGDQLTQLPDSEGQASFIPDIASQDESLLDSEGADDDSLPDWLSGEDEFESAAPALADEDLPDGLADEKAGDIASDIAKAAGVAKMLDDRSEIPDWLADHKDEVESAAPSAAESSLPDWLSDMEGVEAPLAAAAASTLAGQDEIPDWLSGMDEEELEATSAVEENLPDWLSDIEGIGDFPESEPELASSAVDESRAVPDWLRNAEVPLSVVDDGVEAEPVEETPFASADEFDDDLFEMDQLADWISDEPQSDLDQVQEKTDPVDGLEPAELPGWLAAMRPIESVATDAVGVEKHGSMENSGPLAGLYGVLAAEPDISRLKKPPVYSSKLHITDAQQTHARVLKELLEAENQPQALPLPPLISSQRVFRIILSGILIVIAFLAVLAGSEIAVMPAPGNIPPGVEQTNNLVNSLTPADTALLAFDYEPGLTGEMDAASAAVVDHMMLKGAKLVLVSTSPTGPALAERFINDVQGDHGYVSGSQYINLGYVPGGVTGLGAFARTPQWVFPNTLNGESAWETEPLKNVTGISDFALVVLITDNPTTARAWVEQVNPELGAVPLVALVSAQAEPMVRPYFDNQQAQIDGLVSGLSGGAAYEVYVRPNVARTYWDAFNIVLIVAVSAILIGGCITVISTSLAKRKESEGGTA